ncbi:MAG: LysR family transcriptional regulator [Myxococcales bacterium]|nr:MAG: LysR family transcriptional regulator [Myxococcales bacterium]
MRAAAHAIQLMFMIRDIRIMNITGVNLNLLVAFDALIEELSVTGAARRAGVTQPAMSNTLAQLRVLFEDPLFLRHRTGLTPTPRAKELAEPIRKGLALLQGALSGSSFAPESSSRRFVIATSDYVELVLLPALLRRLARVAPGVRLALRPWSLHEAPPELARGELDLMLGFYDKLPPHHQEQLLFSDEYVCVVRRHHPSVKTRLTLAKYLQLSHVLVSSRSDSPGSVDRALSALGKQRTVGARVSHFLTVPVLVSQTDYVAALDRRVAEVFARPLGLKLFPPPLKLPRGNVGMVWHEQQAADPGQRWLRSLIADVASAL